MTTRGALWLVASILLAWSTPAGAQTKMTIATGVDPVFSAYYVAQEAGLFKKHGLDVRINTGPSGSAMVSFLINGQIESAFGSEIAGVANHNLDPNVVVVAQDRAVAIEMTLTTPNCPSAQELPTMVENAAASVPGVGEVKVNIVWDPPWDPSRMSDEARAVLNMW